MVFYKKLDFLMKTQGVSNSSLARALSVDPSLVSRWRTGARKPAKNNNYLKNISEYFATKITTDSQKESLFDLLGMKYNSNKDNIYSISDLIYSWLSEKRFSEKQFVEGFFKKLNKKNVNTPPSGIDKPELQSFANQSGPEVFYGREGKREGVIKFLSAISAHNDPCTMLLYSDESMEWLTGDKKFYLLWESYLMDILSKGHKIKIIHTVNRELSEKISAIEHWLPLYMTGGIEPYYYPKYQEHIFKRSMFIAPGIAALTSNTLAEYEDQAEQFLYTEHEIIDNLTKEFNTLLGMCRPLMRIFTGNNTQNFYTLQLEFEEQPGNCISLSDMLSFVTMPASLIKKLLNRNNINKELRKTILALHKERFRAFLTNIENNKYTEIINLSFLQDLSHKKSDQKPGDFFYELPWNYKEADYSEHIEHIINLLRKHQNYHLLITRNTSANVYFISKDEVGTIVAKNDASPILFAFNQKDMTNSFYIYLQGIIKEIHKKDRNKECVINRLSEFVKN